MMSPIATFCCLVSQRLFFLFLERESPSFILSCLFFARKAYFFPLIIFSVPPSVFHFIGGRAATYVLCILSISALRFRFSFHLHDLCLFFSLGGSVTTRLREQLNSSHLHLVCICTFLPTSRYLVYTFSSSFRVEK